MSHPGKRLWSFVVAVDQDEAPRTARYGGIGGIDSSRRQEMHFSD